MNLQQRNISMNLFYLHLIGLLSSKNEWREAKKTSAHFKRGNYNEIYFTASSPEQFLKNSPGTTRFRGKFLLDLIRQLYNNRN